MELTQLRYFIAAAEMLHFAHAAEACNVTQPTLSRSIAALEKELGTTLIDRSDKWNLSLTAAGRVFLPEAKKTLQSLERARELTRAAGEGHYGKLVIGAISSMIGHEAFIATLANMQKRYRGALIELRDSTTGALNVMLRENEVDLALMRRPESGRGSELLELKKLYDDELLAVLPAKHPLRVREDISAADLRNESFVLVPDRTSSVFRSRILEFCRKEGGFSPRITHEISNSYTALRLVAAGAGVTIVSRAYEGTFPGRVIFRRFSGMPPDLPMYAVSPGKGLPPLGRTFLEMLCCELKKSGRAKRE